MKPRSVRQRPEKALSAAKSAVAVLLALLVLQSGFLGGLPAVEAQSAGLSARDGARVAKEAAGTAGAQNLDATPALAADLSSSGSARLRWDSPSRNLNEEARSRLRTRSASPDSLVPGLTGRRALRPPYDPVEGLHAHATSKRLLLQTAQLAAG